MYTQSYRTQKASKQPHVAGALRQFADMEVIKEVAESAQIRSQMLRNKLLPNQPHQLSVHELIEITRVSGNRCIVDGLLYELNCVSSVSVGELESADKTPLIERALEISTNAAQLGSIALDVKAQRRVTARMRHEAVNRATRVMTELAIFVHDVEQKFQAIPVLSIAVDAVQTIPMPGLM